MVVEPASFLFSATSKTLRKSAEPLLVAEIISLGRLLLEAKIFAMVVFPEPDSPQKISEGILDDFLRETAHEIFPWLLEI